MSAATQNEIDRLYQERDKARAERDALAAYVEAGKVIVRAWGDGEYSDVVAAAKLAMWKQDAPTTSLAQLKAELWQTEGCICQECGERYRDDLIVDDALWEKIKPAGKEEGAGLLCGKCIFDRATAELRSQAEEVGQTLAETPACHRMGGCRDHH